MIAAEESHLTRPHDEHDGDNAGVGVSNETCQLPFPLNRWRAAHIYRWAGWPEVHQGQPRLHLHLKAIFQSL